MTPRNNAAVVISAAFLLMGCLGGHNAPDWYVKRATALADQLGGIADNVTETWTAYQAGKAAPSDAALTFRMDAAASAETLTWVERLKDVAPVGYENITWEEGGAASLLNMSATYFAAGARDSNADAKHAGESDLALARHHLDLARDLIRNA